MVNMLNFANSTMNESEGAHFVKNINFKFILKGTIFHRLSTKKRGVSEIITTLMLLSITVIGAVFLYSFFQGADLRLAF